MTSTWGLTEGGIKKNARDPRVLPKTVIYDPALTVSMSAMLSATSGMNAVAHCVEALYAQEANPIVSLMAEEGIRAMARSLPVVVKEPANMEARSRCRARGSEALRWEPLAWRCIQSAPRRDAHRPAAARNSVQRARRAAGHGTHCSSTQFEIRRAGPLRSRSRNGRAAFAKVYRNETRRPRPRRGSRREDSVVQSATAG